MGIYYCCDIYVGGIGDTLNYALRLKPCMGNSPRTQQLFNSPPPTFLHYPTPIINKLICKILKRNETNNSIHIPVMLYDYLESLQNLLIHHLTTQKKSTSIPTSKKISSKHFPLAI